jgi:hypothetical protein
MNYDEFIKMVNQEINWLSYYSNGPSKDSLSNDRGIYEQLISIGYAKRKVELSRRCAPAIVTSQYTINSDITPENLIITNDGLRNSQENRYTPLEVFWLIFPNRRDEIIFNIKCDQNYRQLIK